MKEKCNGDSFEETLQYINPVFKKFDKLFTEFSNSFYNQDQTKNFNLRRKKIDEMSQNSNFRFLLNTYITQLNDFDKIEDLEAFSKTNLNYTFRYRRKNKQSLNDKIRYYCDTKGGKFVINKSLNDLMGGRIIIDNADLYKAKLIDFFNPRDDNNIYKVIYRQPSSGYHAIHLYLQKQNYQFPWEFQIWDTKYAIKNSSLHAEHEKQKREGL